MLAVAAISFDAFWHVSIGRESIFIPPHLILYSSLFFLLILLYSAKRSVPKITWFFIAAIIISGPADEWWHSNFGQEQITSIMIVWSPPHLFAEVSIVGLLGIVFRRLVSQDARLSSTLQWAAISSIALFVLIPFDLLSPYQVLGEYGGIINIFAIGTLVYFYLQLQKGIRLWPLITTMFILSMPLYLQEGPITSFQNFHQHMPLTILALVYVIPAIIVDFVGYRKSNLFKTIFFLLSYVAIYLGSHVATIDGYREFWFVLVVYGVLTPFISLLAAKAGKKIFDYCMRNVTRN
ncbi:MAG: hypothetical protein WAO91_00160 [Candidatus Nitrosotenuis sp.]